MELLVPEQTVRDAAPHLRTGAGLLVEGRSNLVVRAERLGGFHRNLVLRRCTNVRIEGGDFSGSHEGRTYSGDAYDERDWLDLFNESVWSGYGAGIVLEECVGCVVEGVRARSAQNGLMLIRSRSCRVSICDFSHNSGWGIFLWQSSDNLLERNRCDRCVRCEDPERYSAGGDSAGIVLSHDCCRNVIVRNSLRYSGDGFFLNGLRVLPSEHNLVAFNDASHSPHNAFESSWSGYNRFLGNIASNSRYGFWCGYSHHNELIGNVIDDCLEWGVAIEHGAENRILGNRLRDNRRGIVLFRRNPDERPSTGYLIAGNSISGGECAITLSQTSRVTLTGNRLDSPVVLETKDGCCEILLADARSPDPSVLRIHEGCDVEIVPPPDDPLQTGVDVAEQNWPAAIAVPEPSGDEPRFHWYDPHRSPGTLIGTAEL